VPAKVIRQVSEHEAAWKIVGTKTYQDLTRRCHATLVETDALTAVEPGRKRIEIPGVVSLADSRKKARTEN
jgi:phenylacetic acid degradation protein